VLQTATCEAVQSKFLSSNISRYLVGRRRHSTIWHICHRRIILSGYVGSFSFYSRKLRRCVNVLAPHIIKNLGSKDKKLGTEEYVKTSAPFS